MPTTVSLLAISGADATVVVTSITLVFAMLVALCFVVTAEGKIFDRVTAEKKAAERRRLDAATAQRHLAAPAEEPAAAAPAPAAPQDGIAPEIVAAIAAAVYATEGAGAAVRGIRRLPAAQPGRRRGAWGDAGVAQNVQPF